MEVLQSKHPGTRPPFRAIIDSYLGQPLELVPINMNKNTVIEILGRLTGGTGPEGMDLMILYHRLLRFGAAIRELGLTVAEFM